MFSREESKKIREEFWINFGKEYPRKWLLYNTKVKGLQLKFTFTNDVAQVSLDVVADDEIIRAYYFEKLVALKNNLKDEFLPQIIFEENYLLPEGKTVSRIYVEMKDVNIHNKKHWSHVGEFLSKNMSLLEAFFLEYKDYLGS
jgi:hypothetical protein